MKDFEKYIKDHRDDFDDQELPEGHFERFEALFDKQEQAGKQKKAQRISMRTIFSIAASIAILVVVGFRIFSVSDFGETKPAVVDSPLASEEFLSTNEFYKGKMDQQIADIMCKLENADAETRVELEADLAELLKENNTFVADIQQDENEEIAIFYLVKHYKSNIQALESINEKLGNHIKC